MRFWVFVPFAPFMLAGPWWFGYALQNGWPWIEVAFAFGTFNFGASVVQSIALTYMVDAYNGTSSATLRVSLPYQGRKLIFLDIIGDVLTAVTSVRNTLSTVFVFALTPWIAAVGVANVFNIIGAVGTLILSFAVVFLWRGKTFRIKTAKTYRYYAARQFQARLT